MNRRNIRIVLFLFVSMILIPTSCSTTVGNGVATLSETDNAFEVFRNQINRERRREYSATYDYSALREYLVDDSDDRNALTPAEIETLQNGKTANRTILTYEEMKEDVDLYFRVLRSHWGAYYYWGGNEVFDNVRDSILERFRDSDSITKSELTNVMHESMDFIKDYHFQIGTGKEAHFISEDERYWFCYTDDVFYLDETGFYHEEEGLKWYYAGCDNESVSMERRLFSDGTLAYGLIQFAPRNGIHAEDTVMMRSGETEKAKLVSWTESTPYSEKSLSDPDFRMVRDGSFSFIQLRSFNEKWKYKLEDFQNSASDVRGSDLLVFDIRSNGGGNSRYFNNWFRSINRNDQDTKMANARRTGPLNDTSAGSEYAFQIHESQGTIQNNPEPVIILVDNNCGSSGESALRGMRTLGNSMVIGTNSIGCDSFGNVRSYVLPNSGINFVYGTDLRCFSDRMENIDGKGFLPDIWCDPADAISAVRNMFVKYGLIDPDKVDSIFDQVYGAVYRITLKKSNTDVVAGKSFGDGKKTFKVSVQVNGETVSDYTYSVDNSIGSVSTMSSGELVFKADRKGSATVTITYRGCSASFEWKNWAE